MPGLYELTIDFPTMSQCIDEIFGCGGTPTCAFLVREALTGRPEALRWLVMCEDCRLDHEDAIQAARLGGSVEIFFAG